MRKYAETTGWGIMKWVLLIVLAFVFSLPFTARTSHADDTDYTVTVAKGYLALRNDTCYDSSNEIGKMYTGETVEVMDKADSIYWTVYSHSLDRVGYADMRYLTNSNYTATVSVAKGYLALRTAQAYDSSNEIGELYSGDTVQIANTEDDRYWLVYAPGLGKGGYVDKNYLNASATPENTSFTRMVSVTKGYLALRDAMYYDSSNEIGELYNGDLVDVYDTGNSDYWYVYAPSLSKCGFVNKDYLIDPGSVVTKTVQVSSGYLALRCSMSYDEDNEIGELYSGDTVEVWNSTDSTYWYVYSPLLGISGYVNCNYLI